MTKSKLTLPKFLLGKKQLLLKEFKKKGVIKAGIFGSYARGDYNKNSDIDILVKTKKRTSLIDFIGIKHAAEDILKKKVDLVEYSALREKIKSQILEEEVGIL